MHLIDEQYTKTPFYGSRRMREALNKVNRKRVQRLMRLFVMLKKESAGTWTFTTGKGHISPLIIKPRLRYILMTKSKESQGSILNKTNYCLDIGVHPIVKTSHKLLFKDIQMYRLLILTWNTINTYSEFILKIISIIE